MPICIGCGEDKRVSLMSNGVCTRCQVHGPTPSSAYSAEELTRIAKGEEPRPGPAPEIVLTTSIDIPGREIDSVVSIVASEVALGLSVFKDIANSWRDFVGGRANTAQKTLKEARTACLDELKREAAALGADAVIAVDLDYNELSTAGSGGILFVAASGTAVRLKPVTAI